MQIDDIPTAKRYGSGQPVVVTWIDIPFSFWIDIAFKVTGAFLIAWLVIGVPIGLIAYLIWLR